nr:hypothetical protein Iba_chr12aCG17360 [Ipomoea batatas]GMD69076.1 hypothetical protein Iba_chr12dCG15440 [Ipomoea batatas]GMD71145.1 hypothetical protein Iba_chr12eCG13140 [Ipomoea batatas]
MDHPICFLCLVFLTMSGKDGPSFHIRGASLFRPTEYSLSSCTNDA